MSTVPFADAININENRRYAFWVMPIILVMFGFGVFEPGVYFQGTDRVVNFSEEFPKEAPFEFDRKAEEDGWDECGSLLLRVS